MDKINIAEILKDKPQGTKLYTPISGDVWLVKTERDEFTDKYPITVSRSEDDGVNALNTLAFTAQGQYMNTGECLLFPSKNLLDWEKFTWERGDVLMDNYGIWCMFDGWITDDFTQFYSGYSVTIDPSNEQTFYEDKEFSTKEFHKVGANAAKDFIASLKKKYGGRFNPGTLKIEKSRPKFKDSDIIYVEIKGRSSGTVYRTISIFKNFSSEKTPCVYADLFLNNNNLSLADKFDGYNILCDWNEITEIRLATNDEKQQLFDALVKKGKTWNADTKQVEDLPKRYNFKPFERVLIRDYNDEEWCASFFSHYADDKKSQAICVNDYGVQQCIPYEGNEELVGTSNKPKEGGKE